METTKQKKYPFGFYACSVSFTFERMAYYSAKWLIAVFFVAAVTNGGLGLSAGDGAKMSANLVAWTYIAPIFGGIISDRFIGARYCIPVGMVLMGVGYLVGAQATDKSLMYVMCILVAIGTGLFKGNISAINGRQFDDPKRLDSAFSIQYTFVNIGSFIGTTIIGIITLNGSENFKLGFTLSAIAMFAGAVWFIIAGRSLGDIGKKPSYIVKP